MPDARDVIAARAVSARVTPGSTSYFSAPDNDLDPSLFRRGRLIPSVRERILSTLYSYWDGKYVNAKQWSTVWVAGSGASYQWSAARQPGDLDVLIGVDYRAFRANNPRYKGLSDVEISDYMNDQFRAELDPHTALTSFGDSVYEETFYVNAGATDIRAIHPYAAYNVSANEWTVLPQVNPRAPHDKDFKAKAREDTKRGKALIKDYETARLKMVQADTPEHRLNAESWVKFAIDRGAEFFDEIHEGRHAAFAQNGQGYGDWANYRWQAAKASGIVPALQQLKGIRKQASDAMSQALYGAPIDDAEHALIKAALWRAGQ